MHELFDSVTPRGIALVGAKLETLLQDYLSRLETAETSGVHKLKPVNFIIITDGISSEYTAFGNSNCSLC